MNISTSQNAPIVNMVSANAFVDFLSVDKTQTSELDKVKADRSSRGIASYATDSCLLATCDILFPTVLYDFFSPIFERLMFGQ